MESPEEIISEFFRVLKDDGKLILTFDLDLRGDKQIGPAEYTKLMQSISKYFTPVFPVRAIHPACMLSTVNSIYSMNVRLLSKVFITVKNLFRVLVGMSMIRIPEYMLGCELLVLEKKLERYND
jgi:hypothetical protein